MSQDFYHEKAGDQYRLYRRVQGEEDHFLGFFGSLKEVRDEMKLYYRQLADEADDEALFIQYWTIECHRSMDEPHEKERELFLRGVKYARVFQSESRNPTIHHPLKDEYGKDVNICYCGKTWPHGAY